MATTLFQSRRFWLAVLDAFTGTLGLLLAFFLAPDKVKDVLTIWGIWQPVIVAVIIGYTVDNSANIAADAQKHVANQSLEEAHVYAVADKVSTAKVIPTVVGDPVVTSQP